LKNAYFHRRGSGWFKRCKTLLCLSFVIVTLGSIFAFISGYAQPASDRIPDGVTINGVSVSGMTKDQAVDALDQFKKSLRARKAEVYVLENPAGELSLADFGLDFDAGPVIEEALGLGKTGNIVQRYKEIEELRQIGKHFTTDLILDDVSVYEYIRQNCEQYNQPALDGWMWRVNGEFEIFEGQTGIRILLNQSLASFKNTLSEALYDKNNGTIKLSVVVGMEEPRGSAEELAKVADVLGTFSTSYKSSGSARSTNVATGTSHINGTLLYPGDVFSAYEAVSPFTESNGYQLAGSYLNGMVVDSLGGGICQVSTTLYNAVLRAELEIVQRSCHSMIVTYVDPSADAAISGTYKDFKFTNSTDYPIYIEGITQDKNVRFTIYGVETRPENRTVAFESEVLKTTQPETEKVIALSDHAVGYIDIQSAHTGYEAQLWKVVRVDGVEQSRNVVNKSSYMVSPRTASVGTYSSDPAITEAVNAAIATNNIAYVESVIALYTQVQTTWNDPNAYAW